MADLRFARSLYLEPLDEPSHAERGPLPLNPRADGSSEKNLVFAFKSA